MKRVISLLLILSFSFLAAGCLANSDLLSSQSGEVFVFGKPSDAVSLDPADVGEGESANVTVNVYDNLVRYKQASIQIEPALAVEWKCSRDGKVWLFKLRQNVKFHDGTPFNAEAVKFNFERQMYKDHPYHGYGEFTNWGSMWGGYPGVFEKIEAIDDYTLKITLKRPFAPFLANLAMYCFGIASPTAIKNYKDKFYKNPVGTGPFKFVQWRPREKIVLVANEDYWDGAPAVKRLIFHPIPNSASRRLQLENGTINLATGLNIDDINRLKANPRLKVYLQEGMNIGFLSINCEKKPFDDVRVRRAVNYAINKKNLIKYLYNDLAVAGRGSLPPGVLGYDPNLPDYEYNPVKAKQLLAEAGYPNGFTCSLWYMSLVRPYMPQPKFIGEAVQADLQAVGIKGQMVTYDWGTYLSKTQNGEHDLCLLGWITDNGDPDNFMYILLDSDNAVKPASNICFYRNLEVHNLLLEAQSCLDEKKRAGLYQKAERIVINDAPWVSLAYAHQIAASTSNIEGFQLHPAGSIYFHKVRFIKR